MDRQTDTLLKAKEALQTARKVAHTLRKSKAKALQRKKSTVHNVAAAETAQANAAAAELASALLEALQESGVDPEPVVEAARVFGQGRTSSAELEATATGLESLASRLTADGKSKEANLTRRVSVSAKQVLTAQLKTEEQRLSLVAYDVIEAEVQRGIDIEASLREESELESCVRLSELVLCMEEMLTAEVECEELVVALAEANAMTQVLQELESAAVPSMLNLALQLENAVLMHKQLRRLKVQAAQIEMEVALSLANAATVEEANALFRLLTEASSPAHTTSDDAPATVLEEGQRREECRAIIQRDLRCHGATKRKSYGPPVVPMCMLAKEATQPVADLVATIERGPASYEELEAVEERLEQLQVELKRAGQLQLFKQTRMLGERVANSLTAKRKATEHAERQVAHEATLAQLVTDVPRLTTSKRLQLKLRRLKKKAIDEQGLAARAAAARQAEIVVFICTTANVDPTGLWAVSTQLNETSGGDSEQLAQNIAALERLRSRLVERGKREAGEKLKKVVLLTTHAMKVNLKGRALQLVLESDLVVEEAIAVVYRLMGQLQLAGDTKSAAQVEQVVSCLEGMFGGELACQELDVAIAAAQLVADTLLAQGDQSEGDTLKTIAAMLRNAQQLQSEAYCCTQQSADGMIPHPVDREASDASTLLAAAGVDSGLYALAQVLGDVSVQEFEHVSGGLASLDDRLALFVEQERKQLMQLKQVASETASLEAAKAAAAKEREELATLKATAEAEVANAAKVKANARSEIASAKRVKLRCQAEREAEKEESLKRDRAFAEMQAIVAMQEERTQMVNDRFGLHKKQVLELQRRAIVRLVTRSVRGACLRVMRYWHVNTTKQRESAGFPEYAQLRSHRAATKVLLDFAGGVQAVRGVGQLFAIQMLTVGLERMRKGRMERVVRAWQDGQGGCSKYAAAQQQGLLTMQRGIVVIGAQHWQMYSWQCCARAVQYWRINLTRARQSLPASPHHLATTTKSDQAVHAQITKVAELKAALQKKAAQHLFLALKRVCLDTQCVLAFGSWRAAAETLAEYLCDDLCGKVPIARAAGRKASKIGSRLQGTHQLYAIRLLRCALGGLMKEKCAQAIHDWHTQCLIVKALKVTTAKNREFSKLLLSANSAAEKFLEKQQHTEQRLRVQSHKTAVKILKMVSPTAGKVVMRRLVLVWHSRTIYANDTTDSSPNQVSFRRLLMTTSALKTDMNTVDGVVDDDIAHAKPLDSARVFSRQSSPRAAAADDDIPTLSQMQSVELQASPALSASHGALHGSDLPKLDISKLTLAVNPLSQSASSHCSTPSTPLITTNSLGAAGAVVRKLEAKNSELYQLQQELLQSPKSERKALKVKILQVDQEIAVLRERCTASD